MVETAGRETARHRLTSLFLLEGGLGLERGLRDAPYFGLLGLVLHQPSERLGGSGSITRYAKPDAEQIHHSEAAEQRRRRRLIRGNCSSDLALFIESEREEPRFRSFRISRHTFPDCIPSVLGKFTQLLGRAIRL